jgi:hypothetical protein
MLHIFIIFPTSEWAVFSLWQKWGWTTRNGDFTNPPSEMPPLPSSTAELLDDLSQAGNGSTGVALWCRPGSNLQVFGPRSRSGCAELSAAGTKRTLPWRWCSLAPKIDLQIGWEITGGVERLGIPTTSVGLFSLFSPSKITILLVFFLLDPVSGLSKKNNLYNIPLNIHVPWYQHKLLASHPSPY